MQDHKGEINLIKLGRVYKKIWELAFPYQDKREDRGHAEITLSFAQQLLGQEKANPDIVIPAIILHDIGWSQLSIEERYLSYISHQPEIRQKHQEEGVKLAKKILDQASFGDKARIEHILEIISGHDTRVGSFSKEDALVRDADKLWRYSHVGFWTAVRITKKEKESLPEYCQELGKYINQEGFFFTESAKNIARRKLAERRGEF